MKSIKQYVWIFEWFAAAILVAFAVTSVIKNEFLLYALGSIFIIFGVFRIVPLFKTTESKLIKWLIIAEILVTVLAGLAMFYFAEEIKKSNSLFGYIVGGVLYLRGFMHLLATSVKNEPTTLTGFLVNIGLITVASIIIANGEISVAAMAWFFFVMIILCALLLIWRGSTDYRNYRGNLVGASKTKKIKKQKEADQEISNPTSDEIKINIIPEEEKDKPSVRVNNEG